MTRCSSIAFFVCVALNNQNEKDCMEKSFCMEKCQITTATSPVQSFAMILSQPEFQQPPIYQNITACLRQDRHHLDGSRLCLQSVIFCSPPWIHCWFMVLSTRAVKRTFSEKL